MNRIWRIGLALAVLTTGTTAALAAQTPPPRDGRDRAQMEERIRAQMTRVIKERLDLTDEQSEELSELGADFMDRRRALFREEQETRRRMEGLVLEEDPDEQEAAELLARVAELRRQEVALFEEEQAALLEVLPAHKVLQLQAVREEMGRRIRSLRRGEGRRPGGERTSPRGNERSPPPWGDVGER